MKSAWFAAFVLPLVCSSPCSPQQVSPNVPPQATSTEAKAATPAAPGSGPGAAAAKPGDLQQAPVAHPAQTAPTVEPVTEAELRQRFMGKTLYLRGLWLDDDLHFDIYGNLVTQSPKTSFTLCAVEFTHIEMTKRRVVLEGARYGIHFEDDGDWQDQATAFDRIRITPKKKHLVIVIDRQEVVKPKRLKEGDSQGGAAAAIVNGAAAGSATSERMATMGVGTQDEAETTTSPAESATHLRKALDKIFAPDLDAGMIAEMPEYWQYFYQAQLDHKSIEPTDASLVRPGPGIEGPTLLKHLVPPSNDFAQQDGVAGVASYKVILGADGKPLGVAVYRPIGFGLDENAVAAIRKSTFAPAMKNGKAVGSVIDLSVDFRIYSKRTDQAPVEGVEAADVSPVTGKPSLPGLFTVIAERR